MAALVEPVEFSNNGEYLAYSSPDGRLKLWEGTSGKLKQEYTPSAHLSATCTCLSWGPTRHDFASPKKKKRPRTSSNDTAAAGAIAEAGLLAMGTASGTVVLYSVAKGDLHSELSNGHTAAVRGLSWHAESDSLFSCSDDQHIVHWSVSSCKVRTKWKADRHSVHAVAAVDAGTVLTASSSVKWWDVESKTVLMKFTGHATEVRQLLPVVLAGPKGGESRCYFLSSAAGDRQLSAWQLQAGGSTSALACLTLSDDALHMGISSSTGNARKMLLSAVTRTGILHIFDLQLNGRCQTPLQPRATVQMASGGPNGQAPHKPQPLPILAAGFLEGDSLLLCYGTFLRPAFEVLKGVGELRGHSCLVRQTRTEASSNKLEEAASLVRHPVEVSKEVTNLAPGHLAPRVEAPSKKTGPTSQLPMEERLREEARGTPGGREPPRADNLCQLLLQGLQSNDPRLLSSVLQRTDDSLVRNTVRRLPLSSVLPLLRELHKQMHCRGSGVYPYMKWTKAVISMHTSYLMTCHEASGLLTPLLELLEARTEVFDKVCRLRGRVDLIMAQVTARHEDTLKALPTEPLCIVQDESSDDEDMDQDGRGSPEVQNMWEMWEEDRSEASEEVEGTGEEDSAEEEEAAEDSDAA
ncbi:WD repeat-containing protein 43 [Ixodes scapularis]|uniref:WD repeat-containing protein 43 n=1 Tax=Ixodes scapularis TaxID=6945 RepID=UPI001C38B6C6|nr:WD repeat-containing protein 43 [Ixodes scapularis]